MYPHASFFNHSCAPNVTSVRHQSLLTLVEAQLLRYRAMLSLAELQLHRHQPLLRLAEA